MSEPPPDYATIAPRVLRPNDAHRMIARAAAAGAASPSEAWETFAARGLIPIEWVTGRDRIFGSGKRRFVPQTMADAVTIAADVRGVTAAEALAREAAARLEPWSGARARRVVWRVRNATRIAQMRGHGMLSQEWFVERATMEALTRPGAIAEAAPTTSPAPRRGVLRRLLDALLGADAIARPRTDYVWSQIDAEVEPLRAALNRTPPPAPHASPWVLRDAHAERAWARAVAAGLRVPDAFRFGNELIPEVVRGRPFAELPNPFAPLLALWSTGYMLRAIEPDAIRLLALEPPAPAPPPRVAPVSLGVYR